MIFDEVAVVIPALEKNRHSPLGDLAPFGETTLLEWKIFQVLGFTPKENIFVSTTSEKIIKKTKIFGINAVKRTKEAQSLDSSNTDWIDESIKSIEKKYILWTQANSPFVSARDYQNMLEVFFKLTNEHDSLISVFREEEYLFYKNKPLNFDIKDFRGRKFIEPAFRVTNGCYICKRDSFLNKRKFFGEKPYFYEVDKLTSLEIKDVDHFEVALNLLPLYFRLKEI